MTLAASRGLKTLLLLRDQFIPLGQLLMQHALLLFQLANEVVLLESYWYFTHLQASW